MNKFNPYDWYKKAFRHPRFRPLVIGVTVLYLLSPIDVLPELFTGPLGFIDDGVLLTIFVTEVVNWLFSKGRGRMTDTEPDYTSKKSTKKKR